MFYEFEIQVSKVIFQNLEISISSFLVRLRTNKVKPPPVTTKSERIAIFLLPLLMLDTTHGRYIINIQYVMRRNNYVYIDILKCSSYSCEAIISLVSLHIDFPNTYVTHGNCSNYCLESGEYVRTPKIFKTIP